MSEGRRWCYVSSISGDVTGWVAGDFLREGSAPGVATHLPLPVGAMPVPQAETPPEPQVLGPAYDTTGGLGCVDGIDAPVVTCSYGAVHEGSGNGFVQITEAGFGGRTITFENGAPVYFDQSQADGDIEMRTNLDGDTWVVFVGDARFVIPARLFGGTGGGMATQLPLAPPEMPAADATVPGTDFNAMAPITCTPGRDAADTTCEAGVVRNGDGSGFISVALPDGRQRAVFFENNVPVRFDQSEADGDIQMTVQQDGDMFTVFIGDLRLVFPLALMAGG